MVTGKISHRTLNVHAHYLVKSIVNENKIENVDR